MMKQLIRNTSSWLWIPTLYFAEGIPYFIVNNISVTMFTRMGVPNGEMALFTSLLYLPWTINHYGALSLTFCVQSVGGFWRCRC